jgi:hypothetical protein
VYINTRDKSMYSELEQTWQSKIAKELAAPSSDIAAAFADTVIDGVTRDTCPIELLFVPFCQPGLTQEIRTTTESA